MRTLTRTAFAIAAAGAASAAYQQAAETRDRRRYPPPGRIVAIGNGRRMHLLSEGTGSPPVVIVPALADNVLGWARTLRAAAPVSRTTVLVYDRAGCGWSGPPRGRVTWDSMADDLHALLSAAGISSPRVIAGHSIGGIIARRYQSRYPGDVAGMLLIDSSHEEQARRLGWERAYKPHLKRVAQRRLRVLGLRRAAANLGLIGGMDDATYLRETVPEFTGAARALDLSSAQRRTVIRECLLVVRRHQPPEPIGALPLTVITSLRGLDDEFRAKWEQMQDELAALSTDTVCVHAERAGHYVHYDDQELVVQAISELVKRCRLATRASAENTPSRPLSAPLATARARIR